MFYYDFTMVAKYWNEKKNKSKWNIEMIKSWVTDCEIISSKKWFSSIE